jgi:magnesium chelatase family protein
MYSKLKTATNIGLAGYPIDVETHISRGLPSFKIVGLGDKAIGEAKERVKAAIKSSGYHFPSKRIVVNLAPSNIPKFGSAFDLPIALGILLASQKTKHIDISKFMFYGELGLNGKIKPVKGIPIAYQTAIREQIQKIIFPPTSILASKNNNTIPIKATSLKHCFNSLNKVSKFKKINCRQVDIYQKFRKIPNKLQIKGCKNSLRALIIAAIGGYHLLLKGPPGCGKSLLANFLSYITPIKKTSFFYDIERIYSISSETPPTNGIPFRNPHHTISNIGMIGGGSTATPGEITLAHKGLLFMDELPQFPQNILNSLRQPLENKEVLISRKNYRCNFPCDFQLVAAMNRCPCGMLGNPNSMQSCKCTPSQINRYQSKISQVILDRIDIKINIQPQKFDQLVNNHTKINIHRIRHNILATYKLQKKLNLEIGTLNENTLKHFLTKEAFELTRRYYKKNTISTRQLLKILNLAKTIAFYETVINSDTKTKYKEKLTKKDLISKNHVSEAISYQIAI